MPYRLQPADVQAKFEEYRKQCDENMETVRYRDKLVQVPRKIIYTLEGFCLFLDIGEEELKKYEDNKNYRAIVKKIRYLVMCRKMHALVNGEGNARALIFDLKVNHGIDPKQAREELDWKITLNLNDGRGPIVIDDTGREEETEEEGSELWGREVMKEEETSQGVKPESLAEEEASSLDKMFAPLDSTAPHAINNAVQNDDPCVAETAGTQNTKLHEIPAERPLRVRTIVKLGEGWVDEYY